MTLWWQSLMETHLCTHREMTIGIVCAHMHTHVAITHEFVAWGNLENKGQTYKLCMTRALWAPGREKYICLFFNKVFFVINSIHSSFNVFSHIYLCAYEGKSGHKHATAHRWGSEDNLQESFLSSFLYMGPGNEIEAVLFGGKHLYLQGSSCPPYKPLSEFAKICKTTSWHLDWDFMESAEPAGKDTWQY